MNTTPLSTILTLRIAIGMLGESGQHGWWSSAFFSAASSAFLAPIFGKTSMLARYHGVSAAAASVHDQHIGIGANVCHLFRLPERMERDMHELLQDDAVLKAVQRLTQTPDSARQYVQEVSQNTARPGVGPVQIAPLEAIAERSAWQMVAQHYLHALQTGALVFPFFAEARP